MENKDAIDRKKIQRQVNAIEEILKSGIENDFMEGELHGLKLVLDGFYLKKEK